MPSNFRFDTRAIAAGIPTAPDTSPGPLELQERRYRLNQLAAQDEILQQQLKDLRKERELDAQARAVAGMPGLTPDQRLNEIMTVDPFKRGPAMAAALRKAETERLELGTKQREFTEGQRKVAARWAASLKGVPAAERAAMWSTYAVPDMRRAGFTDAEIGQAVPSDQVLDLMTNAALDPDKQAELAGKLADERRKTELHPTAVQQANATLTGTNLTNDTTRARLPEVKAKATAEQFKTAGQTIAGVQDQPGYDRWYARQPREIQDYFGAVFQKDLPLMIEKLGMDATARTTAERQAMPNTPAELAILANDVTQPQAKRDAARLALKELERHAIASRPQTNVLMPGIPSMNQTGDLTGAALLKTLPSGLAAEIRAMAEGRLTAPMASSRAPGAQQKRALLLQYDPGFSEQRVQVRKAFTSGPDGRNIGALNTAMVHLDRLGDAADAMKNGTFTPGNAAYNYFADKFGSEKVTNFHLLKDAVAGEMAAALKGNATDVEIANMKTSIRDINSPSQMAGVVAEGMAILNDKANTYNERYHALMPDDPWSPILPSARAAMDRRMSHGQPAQQHQQGGGVVEWERGPNGVPRPVPRPKGSR